MSLKVKKGDKVIVLSGKDKGKTGRILEILPSESRAVVEGINLVTKHMRRRSESEPGGIKKIPSPLNISKLALFCANCQKGVRFGIKILEAKEKMRFCKKCQQTI